MATGRAGVGEVGVYLGAGLESLQGGIAMNFRQFLHFDPVGISYFFG